MKTDEDQPEERTLTVSFGPQGQPGDEQSVREDEFILKRLEKMKKSVDPRKELNMLKSLCGGFKLAYKLMTEELYDQLQIVGLHHSASMELVHPTDQTL